jgi:hypothetical protein
MQRIRPTLATQVPQTQPEHTTEARYHAIVGKTHTAAKRRLEHDPEKWMPVFGKRSSSNKEVERDGDSKKSHPALAAELARGGGNAASSAARGCYLLRACPCGSRARGGDGLGRAARRPVTAQLRSRAAFERVRGARELDCELSQSFLREEVRALPGHPVAVTRVLAKNLRVHVGRASHHMLRLTRRIRFPRNCGNSKSNCNFGTRRRQIVCPALKRSCGV